MDYEVNHFRHKDAKGQSKPDALIGKTYLHVKTKNLYTVKDALFDSSLDQWSLVYDRVNGNARKEFQFVRPMSEFLDGRFLEVS
jgi:hypothetical protein